MSGRTLAAPALSPATSADRRLEYGPVPAFVRPVSMPDPDTAEAELHGGARLLLADFQHDATNPRAGLYMRQVTQAVTGIGVATVSRYQVSIDPRYQTLVIHEATVIRDGERQSREGRIAADFLRQEPELADGVMTGMELAVLRIEDIRRGDILDIAYSVTGENPLLAPHQTRCSRWRLSLISSSFPFVPHGRAGRLMPSPARRGQTISRWSAGVAGPASSLNQGARGRWPSRKARRPNMSRSRY